MTDSELQLFLTHLRADVTKTVQSELHDSMRGHIYQAVREELGVQLQPIRDVIGEVNEDGTGGSGLSGQLARTVTKVDTLFAYRNIGAGFLLAISVTSALLYLGLKGWLIGIVHGHDVLKGGD